MLEIGCGTGMFAGEAVRRDERAQLTASELDSETLSWVREHRPHPRIDYCSRELCSFADRSFDTVAAIEVIEHVRDYGHMLAELARVADHAVITTPNKRRSAFDAVAPTPAFSEHVREWTAGEFYWVLRVFWAEVSLYTLPDFRRQVRAFRADERYEPTLRAAPLNEYEEPLLAACAQRIASPRHS